MAARTASYRGLFRVGEFRALFLANVVSLVGDQVAVVALAVLVYDRTSSPFLTAATYTFGYVPWVLGGPVLSTFADRHPRRRVLLVCAVAECALIGLAALPGLPTPLLLVLVGAASLLVPPAESAWGALLPEILDDEHYVLSLSLNQVVIESAQLGGFVAGGALVVVLTPRGAFLADAATFLLAAVLILVGVRVRPRPAPEEGTSLLRDARAGLGWCLRHPRVRHLLLLVWLTSFYLIVPEALATGYADELGRGPGTVGVLMAAVAAGLAVGGTVLARFVPFERQLRLMRPLALAGALPLLVVALRPGFVVSVVCFVISGVCLASMIPARAAVMTLVPDELRGRVIGVAATGLALAQVVGMLAAGGAAQVLPVSTVIAGSGVVALVALAFVVRSDGQPTAAPGAAR